MPFSDDTFISRIHAWIWLITDDIYLDYLAEAVFFGFSSIKFLLFSLSYCTLWKEVTMWSLHLKSGRLCSSYTPRGVYIHKLFGILQRKFFSSLAFIYRFSRSFILLKTHGDLFYTLDHNLILCYWFCCLNCPSFGH